MIPDLALVIARSAADSLMDSLPWLRQSVEGVLAEREGRVPIAKRADQYGESAKFRATIATLVVAIAGVGWNVYTDLASKVGPANVKPEVVLRQTRTKVSEEIDVSDDGASHVDRITETVVDEIISRQGRED